MDSFLIFWIALFLVLISLIIGLIFLTHWIPKKFGNKKVGLLLSSIIIISIGWFAISVIDDEELFSKNDANDLLREHRFKLEDDFELIDNES